MNRHVLLVLVWLLALTSPLFCMAAAPPNVLLFLADDHGFEYAGCYGNASIRTPHIDRLASEGMRFTHVFAGSPTCVPSRAVLFTGMMPLRNGAFLNHSFINDGITTLPVYFQRLGYATALANKTHIAPQRLYPFEYLAGGTLPPNPRHYRKYRQEGLNPQAIDDYLRRQAADDDGQPFFLVASCNSPHVTWVNTRGYVPEDVWLPPYVVDTPFTRIRMAAYYSEVSDADAKLGAALASLERYGLTENTIVVYGSDQGAEWPHAKWNLYDAGIRTPFVVRWPGVVTPGRVSGAIISYCDLLPTLLQAAGGSIPDGLDGRSFLGVLSGRTDEHREAIYASHSGDGAMNDFPMRCIRTRTHKLILNLKPRNTYTTHFTRAPDVDHKDIWDTWTKRARTDPASAEQIRKFQHRDEVELYDLRADPWETRNLAGAPSQATRVQALRAKVESWMRQQGDLGVESEDRGRRRLDEYRQRLRARAKSTSP